MTAQLIDGRRIASVASDIKENGIGPMTIAMLMHNTVLAAKMQSKIL